jgi:hypothetical protein
MQKHDIFISYASEDRQIVHDIVKMLFRTGVTSFWWDQTQIKPSESIPHKVDDGLAGSRYLVAIVSKNYTSKHWTRKELDGSSILEQPIIPVWVDIDANAVRAFSPTLAACKAILYEGDPEYVACIIADLLLMNANSVYARSVGRRESLQFYWGMVWLYIRQALGVLDPKTQKEMDEMDLNNPWDEHIKSESGYTHEKIQDIRANLTSLNDEDASLAILAILKRSSDCWFPTYENELAALEKAGIITW